MHYIRLNILSRCHGTGCTGESVMEAEENTAGDGEECASDCGLRQSTK